MGASLPPIPRPTFDAELRRLAPEPLGDAVLEALHRHYEELARWNPRLSLVGPGTVDEVLARHYGESLAALPLVPADGELVDVGSGAGFPGLVLAAARPRLRVTLLEPRQRKWAFLETSRRRAGLSCRCLDARVQSPLPEGLPDEIHVVTCRAVRVSAGLLGPLLEHSPRLRLLLWQGEAPPSLPPEMSVVREVPLPGSERRRIVEATLRP